MFYSGLIFVVQTYKYINQHCQQVYIANNSLKKDVMFKVGYQPQTNYSVRKRNYCFPAV